MKLKRTMEAQRPKKKEGERKKVKRGEPSLGHEHIHPPRSRSLGRKSENAEKDV